MRFIIQRVRHASVTIDGEVRGKIGKGFMVLIGIGADDTKEIADKLVRKLVNMRIFEDAEGRTNLGLKDVEGELLLISQFTLYADCKKGNRPSYIKAAKPEISVPLYERFCKDLSRALGKEIGTGTFGADMKVELLNDGPVTICMDTKNKE